MEVNVIVPSMGESITSAVISSWIASDGDFVKKDTPIFELETDKITSEINAEISGIISLKVQEEEEVEIGQIVAIITESDANPIKEKKEEIESEQISQPSTTPIHKEDESIEIIDNSDKEDRKKMSPLRKKISQRLVTATQETALLTTFNEVDMKEVMDLRKKYQTEFTEKYGIKLGFMSFFTKAVVSALKLSPMINSRIEGDYIIKQKYFDIGIAVGTDKGLMVPVVRDCENKTFSEIEQSIAEYAQKARESKIEMNDLQGGVFTISNGGIYGSMLSTPIINFPQPAILGLHKIQERAVVINGKIVARPMMYLALSYDHRLIDGKEAVSFLVNIKESIEQPDSIFNL